MRLEIKSAATFLMNLLRMGHTLNEQQLDIFRGKLEDLLRKHYQHHWFPDKPCKGSGYRCLRINHKMDPLIARAALASGVDDSSLLHNLFPNELTLWIDPREVSYRIGENGSICVLYDGTPTTTTNNNNNNSNAASNNSSSSSSSSSSSNATSSSTTTSNTSSSFSSCKHGLDNMIMDPRNMNYEQFATCVSS